jgi:hypothetical protein
VVEGGVNEGLKENILDLKAIWKKLSATQFFFDGCLSMLKNLVS